MSIPIYEPAANRTIFLPFVSAAATKIHLYYGKINAAEDPARPAKSANIRQQALMFSVRYAVLHPSTM